MFGAPDSELFKRIDYRRQNRESRLLPSAIYNIVAN